MTRAYIRLDPSFDERKESYPDGPYATLIATFCLAEHQPERGRFRSIDYLRRLLGHRGRHLKFLVDHGDVTELPDKRAYVDGWDEWQEGDWKVAERVERIRNRPHGTPPVTPRVTPVVTVPVTPDVTADRLSGSGGIGGGADKAMSGGDDSPPPADEDEDQELAVVAWLANHGCLVQQSSGYYRNIVTGVARHGGTAIIEAMERLAKAGQKNGDVKGFLFGAIDALDAEARPNLRDVSREDTAERESEAVKRRVERTKRHLHEIGHHEAQADPLCPACKAVSA